MNYKELKNLLIEASNAYYKDSSPIMTDYEFDKKLKELEALERKQGFRDDDSPTVKPGSDLSENINLDNKHSRKMLSLENTYTQDDVEKWLIDSSATSVILQEKFDGGSAAIKFMDGKVVKALTRGDGEIGEDITNNVKLLDWSNISPTFNGEVRGELILTKQGFKELNKSGKYQNARNLLSGSMKLLNKTEFKTRAPFIKFFAYWLEDSKNIFYEDDLKDLKRNGFDTGSDYIKADSKDAVFDAIKTIEKKDFEYDIDGAVLKINNKIKWKELGETSKFPRWAKAYKYKQESFSTKVSKIEFCVGRTGKITPLIWFDPVFIDGSTVQKATMNNETFYNIMDIAIGDTISVQKAAAIIPQIISVDERPKDRKVIKFPKVCPSCGSKLVKHNLEHNDVFCDNPKCKERVVDNISNYTTQLEIDGFAKIIISKLYDSKLLMSIEDLYRLSEHKKEIGKLERLSLNLAEKLINNIEKSKSSPLWKLISALGIPGVGPRTSKLIAEKYKSITKIQVLTKEELMSIPDIGEIVSKNIVDFFNENKKLIQYLSNCGVKMSDDNMENSTKVNLKGKTFCITGPLSIKREKYIELIEGCGGKFSSSVSKKTTYLISNEKNSLSLKFQTAKALGIPIITEEEFLEMCDDIKLLKEVNI